MPIREVPHLRIMREPEPLAAYLRPHLRDMGHLAELLAAGRPAGSGIIIDGRYLANAGELRDAARSKGLDVLLDPNSVELSSPHGFHACAKAEVPWLPRRSFSTGPWTSAEKKSVCERLAEAAVEFKATSVFAPSSLLWDNGLETLANDVAAVHDLRRALNMAGGGGIRIHYPLVGRLRLFAAPQAQPAIVALLRECEPCIESIWLRVTALGFQSCGPQNLRRYLGAARALHAVGKPVVADRAGVSAFPLMALGAVAGVSSAITMGERYDPAPLFSKKRAKGHMLAPRVYLPALGLFVSRKKAAELLKHSQLKHWLQCQRSCCSRGSADMIGDPRRHFVVSRAEEVRELESVPKDLRGNHYLERWVRPASDRATAAMKVDESLKKHRRRLDDVRVTVSTIIEEDHRDHPTISLSMVRRSSKLGA